MIAGIEFLVLFCIVCFFRGEDWIGLSALGGENCCDKCPSIDSIYTSTHYDKNNEIQ